jgi:hypothetical protein
VVCGWLAQAAITLTAILTSRTSRLKMS